MNHFFKTSAIALAVLSVAGTTCAGTINGFFAGGEALDMQPRNEDLQFVTVFPGTPTGGFSNIAIVPSYNWGWRAYAGANFCGNEDITGSWLQFHTKDRRSIANPTSATPPVPGFSQPRWFFISDWSNVSSHVTTDLDDVYGEFGHTVTFQNWAIRFAGGIEWAKINSDLTVQAKFYDNPLITGAVGFKSQSHTQGVGPRVALDLVYQLPYNFSVFSDVNAALLIGYTNISLDSLNTLEFLSDNFSNRHIVVPKLGMRLGVAYSYAFGQLGGEGAACQQTVVTAMAGWQGDTFIHSIQRPDAQAANAAPTLRRATSTSSPDVTVSNYSYEGLFLGVKVSTGWF